MISPALFIAIFLPLALSEFIIPSEGPRLSLMAGQVQEIQYKTSFSTYSIALWQQFTGSARLGPILYRKLIPSNLNFCSAIQNASFFLLELIYPYRDATYERATEANIG